MPKIRYTYPQEVEVKQLRAQAARRRRALTNAGCSTYTLGFRGGVTAIICLCCGLGSVNLLDIQNRYCGFCRDFHREWREDTNHVVR